MGGEAGGVAGGRHGGASAPGAFKVWVPVEVRYSDLDDQGRVNNAFFFTYFEQGRIGYFNRIREIGRSLENPTPQLPPLQGEGRGVVSGRRSSVAPGATDDRLELPLVVSEAHCVYRRPIASLAPLAVGVRTAKMGHASLVIEYVVSASPEGVVYATGGTTLACVDMATGRPRGLPEWAATAVRRVEGLHESGG